MEAAERTCRELAPRLHTLSFEERRYVVEKLVRRVELDGWDVSVETIVPIASLEDDAQFAAT